MQPRKLSVAIAGFPYGGNGGVSSEVPDLRHWCMSIMERTRNDQRIERLSSFDISDTPITMSRNQAVVQAKAAGYDVLVMIDSDMKPDCHWAENPRKLHYINPHAKPFWETAFDFLYDNWDRGPRCIAAPYCGPPPFESPYIFKWKNVESDDPDGIFRLCMVEREHAALCTGIEAVDALPTGLIMFDLRLFDILEQPWFFYEYEGDGPPCHACGVPKPGMQARKSSTEDVVLTRDLQLHCQHTLGYNPLYVAWDCWAGHWKPKCVGMPRPTKADQVAKKLADAVKRGHRTGERLMTFEHPALSSSNRNGFEHSKCEGAGGH